MLPENNMAILSESSTSPTTTATAAAFECSSMLNDMKKIDDDIKSELERIKLDGAAPRLMSSRQKIKIHNLDSYLKSNETEMLMDEDDSNEFYRLPPSLSCTKLTSGMENFYEKLSDVSMRINAAAAATNTSTVITEASSTVPVTSKLNDENGEVEVEIRKENRESAGNGLVQDNDKKPNLYDFLSLNLDRYKILKF